MTTAIDFDLTYDALGRIVGATPIKEEAGARADSFSEPLEFTWYGDTNLLLTVHGKRSGYLRELAYDGSGVLVHETISMPKNGKGYIEYVYLANGAHASVALSASPL